MIGKLTATATLLLLTGCGQYYWSRPGASYDDFAADERSCTQSVGVPVQGKSDQVLLPQDPFRLYLKSRGWTRGWQQYYPPPGWYRGHEDEGPFVLR